jgi:hypothetical protein
MIKLLTFILFGVMIMSVSATSYAVVRSDTGAGGGSGDTQENSSSIDASTEAVCDGVSAVGGGQGCGNGQPDNRVNTIITNLINIFSWAVGVVAVFMVIFGGFKIITASGDSQKVTQGRNAIIYALIGLVVVALAQIIVKFVIGKIDSAV